MGEVVWLGRYPVKSMAGESLQGADVDDGGLVGDRTHALLDAETGLVASAKNPRKWSELLHLTARRTGSGVVITLPGGQRLDSGSAEADGALSGAIGRPVRLIDVRPEQATLERLHPEGEPDAGAVVQGQIAAGTPGRSFVDFGPVHLVTTASLAALDGLDHRRLRPNIVIRMFEGHGFVENDWPGRTVSIGGVRLRGIAPTPRCVVPTLDHGDGLPADPHVLRTVASRNRVPVLDIGVRSCAGAYAVVTEPGRIRIGDLVTVG